MSENGRTPDALRAGRGAYWTIARTTIGLPEVLTLRIDGAAALAVFGFEEEAELFHLFEGLGTGWRVRETAAAEVVRLLFGPRARARLVVLDPLPATLGGDINQLFSLDRADFARLLLPGA